jgi:hypothetical protein
VSTTLIVSFSVALALVVLVGMVLASRKRDQAWEEFAREIGGRFEKKLVGGRKVQAQVGNSALTLDSYSVSSGDSSTQYTRMVASVPNPQHFQFTIVREGVLARLDKALGLKTVAMSDPAFDRDFVVRGNDEARLRALLLDPQTRQLILDQRSLRLILNGDSLQVVVKGLVRDAQRLMSMFQLLAQLLRRL